jgi:Family of unknown function (DUF6364)
MKTKLTLSMKGPVIEQAKKYAKLNGQSLSGLIENYLKAATGPQQEAKELTPIVKSMKGSFKAPDAFDYEEELTIRLTEKYL